MEKSIRLSRVGRNVAAFFEEQNAWVVFALLCLGYVTTSYIQDTIILTNDVYYNTLGEQLTIERIDAMLEKQAEWKWISYLLTPFAIFFQVLLITLSLNCGTILMNYKIDFQTLFVLILKSSTTFLMSKIAITFILLFTKIRVVDDLMSINKFALSGFIYDKVNIPKWLNYPFSLINIFEFTFWLLLSLGISRLLQKSFKSSLSFVAMTYGLGLLIWITFIIFLQLNLS
jgi:hypothetical protein